MSKTLPQNKLDAPATYSIDMTTEENRALERFINDGLPGIATIKEGQVAAAYHMYLNGSSYQEISVRLGIKKYFITFLAHKHKWYDVKITRYTAMLNNLNDKTELAHAKSVDFLTDYMAVLETYYRDIIDRFVVTKDKRVLESADMKNMQLYLKCMEHLSKFRNATLGEDGKGKLGFNLPNGATFKRLDDNTIEVTPKSKLEAMNDANLGEVLSALAELKKQKSDQ